MTEPARGHGTMQEAALAGMDTCKRTMPRENECGFGVYQDTDGRFYFTEVQTGKEGSIDGMKIRMPSRAKLVAFGHTHPKAEHVGEADDTSHAFSPEDLSFAKRMGLTMFMGSEKSGQVVQYDHGKTKSDKHSRLGKISYGEPIGPYGFELLAPKPPEPTRRDQIAAAYDQHMNPTTP